jgi:hypothetical protein
MLFIGSGDELCGLLPALFQAAAYHLPAVIPSAFLAVCLMKVHMEISYFSLPLSPVSFQ